MSVVVFSPDLEGMDCRGRGSEWVCRRLTLCSVDPMSDLLLLVEVGLPCLRRVVVLCHGRGERYKEDRDPPGIYT
jgi:hypothetical protein